jgi:hypothetical protein
VSQENAEAFLHEMADLLDMNTSILRWEVTKGHKRFKAEETLPGAWIILVQEHWFEGGWKTVGIIFSYNSRREN